MKQIIINVPDNCELKQDGNTYTIVKKEKKLNYEDIAKDLFDEVTYYINFHGDIICDIPLLINSASNCTSTKQAEKLLAINKLMNVAKYLNGDWQPDWEDRYSIVYFIYIDKEVLNVDCIHTMQKSGDIYFKSEELAKQAIEILGEETIKLALCTDY